MKKTTPKVSVLMPAYNAEQYIAQAIDSVLNQVFEDWELLIINDGSTDQTENIIQSYTDKRIKYAKSEQNEGIISTRNRLINSASGQYLAFLDSDDIALPQRLGQQVQFLDLNPDYGMCGTWCCGIDGEGHRRKKINMADTHAEIKCALLFASTFVNSSVMIRRQLLTDHYYDKDFPLAEDYELWCRLAIVSKLRNIPKLLNEYRSHTTNISLLRKQHLDALVKEIYKKQFATFGLDALEAELNIHSAMRDKSLQQGSNATFFIELKTWLQKLYQAAADSSAYDVHTLTATVCFRWIFACKERGAFMRILSFPIKINIKEIFILIRMIYKRL